MVILWASKLKGIHKPLSVNQGGKPKSSARQFSVLSTSDLFFPLCFSLKTRHNLLGFPGVSAWGPAGLAASQCQLGLQTRNNPPGMLQSVDLMGQESHQP